MTIQRYPSCCRTQTLFITLSVSLLLLLVYIIIQIDFVTPPAPAQLKTEENTTQESNQQLSAPLIPSSVPVSCIYSVGRSLEPSMQG